MRKSSVKCLPEDMESPDVQCCILPRVHVWLYVFHEPNLFVHNETSVVFVQS